MVTENFQEITLISDPYRKYDLLQRLTLGDEITESKTDEKPKYASSQHNQSPWGQKRLKQPRAAKIHAGIASQAKIRR